MSITKRELLWLLDHYDEDTPIEVSVSHTHQPREVVGIKYITGGETPTPMVVIEFTYPGVDYPTADEEVDSITCPHCGKEID